MKILQLLFPGITNFDQLKINASVNYELKMTLEEKNDLLNGDIRREVFIAKDVNYALVNALKDCLSRKLCVLICTHMDIMITVRLIIAK